MATKDDEERQLRSVALQNASAILLSRQRIERELAAERERLRITLASIGDAVISTDAEGRVTYLNGVAEALTGWPQAEAEGRPLPEVFHIVNEKTRRPAENPAFQALRQGVVVGLANHTVLIARDGTERPIDDSAAPMLEESGSPVGVVLVFRDVTERRSDEEIRARLAAIVESSHDAIVSKGLDGVIRTWNAGAERLFGYRAEEAVGRSITLIIPVERLGEEKEILAQVTRGEPIEHFETVRLTKDGRRLDISLTVSPIRDSENRIIGVSKIARDVTERRRAEEERREAVEALKEADRRKDEFLALLAHELRNPLAPVRNGLQVMRLAAGNADLVAKTRDMMDRQLSHMVRLIDDLLDISRISRNKVELRRSRVLLGDVVSSAVETARPALEAAGHELTVVLPPEPVAPGRRPHPAGPGVWQPTHQQRQVHRARRTHLARCHAGGRRSPGGGPGYRDRHPRLRPAEHLRHVQPGRPVDGAQHRRSGHRARAGKGLGRDARRDGRSGESRRGQGQHLHC